MKRNIRIFYTIFAAVSLLFGVKATAQPLSDIPLSGMDDSTLVRTEISLLTCEPHAEVYSLYGHTAIRVNNRYGGTDVAINWGVFDSRQPNFVMHFVLGQTDYMMAVVPTEMFLREYYYYGSQVYQQRLALTVEEKRRILLALEENNRPENRQYRYNFYYDNCTTRARDVILNALDGKVTYQPTEMQKGEKSFRDLIHWKNEGYPWCRWGNDFLLGVGSDRNATHAEREFIPEVLQNDFDSAYVVRANGKKTALVDSAFVLLPHGISMAEPMADFPFSPLVCSLIFLAVILLVTLSERYVIHKRIRWLDYALFYTFGLLGLILVVMLFSEHPTVRVNLQIFLFCPLWLIIFSPLVKGKQRKKLALCVIILFYIGTFFQVYVEGSTLLALSLLIRILNTPTETNE